MRSLPFVLLLVPVITDSAWARSPYVLPWSSRPYGPDGPWQAVTISIGSNGQSVDLYPGANWDSTIMSDTVCSNKTLSSTCYAAQAGTYNQNESTTAHSLPPTPWSIFYWGVEGESISSVVSDQVNLGGISVPNVSFTAISQTYQTYPNGREYPVAVGNLALGAPQLKDYTSNLTLNMIASWLYTDAGEEHGIPSYSYGMHIGSVNPAIPGSLILGGYDKSRALGDVSAQPVSLQSYSNGALQITLQDIGIGVAAGASPFNFTQRDGLFLQDSGNVLPKPLTIDPTKPYMYLPEATCDAITASLPIGFDTGLGLYLWDTTSSEYTKITSSPAYVSFTFNKNGFNNQNFTVNVPFSLLALTLQDPLVEKNATYFPCFLSTDSPVLGRAFLQAAFVGVNWFEGNNTGQWFMAQGPGPGVSSPDITTINAHDGALEGSSVSWEQTWDGHWTVLGGNKSDNGLSTGAKAGIGVGVAVAGVILIAAGAWIVVTRRKRKGQPNETTEAKPRVRNLSELPVGSQHGPATELATKAPPQEIMSPQGPLYELD